MAAVAESVDLDALETSARANVQRLEETVARLSLDAVKDPAVREELVDCESQLTEAERELERLGLARGEQGRRDQEAAEQAEAGRRDAALQRAQELQSEREKAARATDSALRKFAHALRQWDKITSEQEALLRQAGWSFEAAMAARPRPWMAESAVQRALRDAGVPSGLIRMEAFSGLEPAVSPGRVRPLAECDAKPVAPLEGKQ